MKQETHRRGLRENGSAFQLPFLWNSILDVQTSSLAVAAVFCFHAVDTLIRRICPEHGSGTTNHSVALSSGVQ